MLMLLLLAFLFFSSLLSVRSIDPPFNDDVLGLIVFKAGLTDPQSRLASWNEEDNFACKWVGVKCDPNTNRVTELTLDGFSLSGHIGRSLVRLQFLRVLRLSRNNFSGTLNPILAEIPSLEVLDLSENSLSGTIPEQLFRQCGSLKEISLANNNLTGLIPPSLTSCFNLQRVNLSFNHLSGQLPSGLWSLASLKVVDLSDNLLEGEIPGGIEKLSDLRVISLRRNSLVGWLPENIGKCLMLKSVDFSSNYFSGSLPTSMRKLVMCKYLDVSYNSLMGGFPDWIGEMRSLEFLKISCNNISGYIPTTIGNLQSLKELNISKNRFVGALPQSFKGCVNLKVIDIGTNSFSGNLPSWLFMLPLEKASLSGNKFSGNITLPSSWSQSFQNLVALDLSSNALSGGIPLAVGNFTRLQLLNLSWNSLWGSIPTSVGEVNTTFVVDMSHNQLTGGIPAEIGKCSSLTTLILSMNNLSGPVPNSITNLSNLEELDFSFNNLSGNLPKELTNLSHLESFNVSFNNLEGELPVGGFFNTIPPSSVIGNPSLCGSIVKQSCPAVHPKPLVLNPNSSASSRGPLPSSFRHKRIMLSISSLIAIGAAVFIALGVVAVSILNMHARTTLARSASAFTFSGGDEFSPSRDDEANYGKLVMFSGEADFAAGAQSLLNKDSEIGRGGFGTVYRAELRGGRPVAIKKLNITSLVKCQEDFEREIKKLGKMKHQNLVSVEGYYWTPSLQLIINEHVACGSLHGRLHNEGSESDRPLAWKERFNVILGVARGLAHLHRSSIIHYNVKSSNVLIDESNNPKVADFALARLLPALDRYVLSSKVQSALGYMAPEFACKTVKITNKCDVYGFGVLTLEMVTGKRPVEYMEDDVLVLSDMVREALDDGRIEECVDKNLSGGYSLEEAIPVVKLGLLCASQVPSNRPDMDEVVRILEFIQAPSENQEQLE